MTTTITTRERFSRQALRALVALVVALVAALAAAAHARADDTKTEKANPAAGGTTVQQTAPATGQQTGANTECKDPNLPCSDIDVDAQWGGINNALLKWPKEQIHQNHFYSADPAVVGYEDVPLTAHVTNWGPSTNELVVLRVIIPRKALMKARSLPDDCTASDLGAASTYIECKPFVLKPNEAKDFDFKLEPDFGAVYNDNTAKQLEQAISFKAVGHSPARDPNRLNNEVEVRIRPKTKPAPKPGPKITPNPNKGKRGSAHHKRSHRHHHKSHRKHGKGHPGE